MKCRGRRNTPLLYRLLGVPLFRRFILRLEKLLRRRRGGQNINYHISGAGEFAIKRFYAFLSYNAFLHIGSIAASVLFLLLYIPRTGSGMIERGAMYLLILINIYCILLQKNSAVELKKAEKKLGEKNKRRVMRLAGRYEELIRNGGMGRYTVDDLLPIIRLKNAMLGQGACVFLHEDTDKLARLSLLMPEPEFRHADMYGGKEKTVGEILSGGAQTAVYVRAEASAARLQGIFGKERTVLCCGSPVIISEGEQVEAFCRLFPDRSPDGILSSCSALIEAINTEVGHERR